MGTIIFSIFIFAATIIMIIIFHDSEKRNPEQEKEIEELKSQLEILENENIAIKESLTREINNYINELKKVAIIVKEENGKPFVFEIDKGNKHLGYIQKHLHVQAFEVRYFSKKDKK